MTTLNLMTHKGDYQVREQIMGLPVPVPKTPTHFPIPHSSLIELFIKQLSSLNLEIVQETHTLGGPKGAKEDQYFGMFQVRGAGWENSDFETLVGLRNAHDMAFRAGLTVGAGILVCSNLCFDGEIVVGHRHTKNVMRDLPLRMAEAVAQIMGVRVNQAARIDRYKNYELTKAEADHLIIKLFEGGAINVTTIANVLKEYSEVRHDEFRENNLFRLWNAVTQVHKARTLINLPNLTTKLNQVLDAHWELSQDQDE